MLMKLTKNGKVASKQQENREVGFRHYMKEHFPSIAITELILPMEGDRNTYDPLLDAFFDSHPNVHHGITMCSKAHIVGDYLLRTKRQGVKIMGYDMVGKNETCLRQGTISFLIAQHAYMQGYNCVDTLFKSIVLKQEVPTINYMPIELLTKENVDFYRRTQA
jgi:LacI family transcriptional regulator